MRITLSLHKMARTRPETIATIYGDRKRRYGELADRVARLAGALQSRGLKPGGRVGVLAYNSDNYIELILASIWAGGVAVPFNTRWSGEEFGAAMADTAPTLVVLDENFFHFRDYCTDRRCPELQHVLCMDTRDDNSGEYEQWIAGAAPMEDRSRRDGDLALLLYTGGTTGHPKGVMLSSGNLMSAGVNQAAAGFGTRGGVYLHAAPMFHMADIQLMINHFLSGGTHCIIPRFDPLAVLEAVERHGVSDVFLVPTMLQAVINHPQRQAAELGSLKTVFYGAAPMSPTLLQEAMRVLVGCGFIQGYGMTETCLATMLPADSFANESVRDGDPNPIWSAGKELPLTELRIAGPSGEELSVGVVGEVQLKGPSITSGYWNNPEKTEELFMDGWLRTGDMAFRDQSGFIHIVDRLKDMIITGGENVYSTEVENVLAANEAVAQCAIVGLADEKWGERVHAAIVLKPGVTPSESDIIAYCREKMTSYKCPRSVSFLDVLPLSPAGKVLKAELRRALEMANQSNRRHPITE